MIIGTKFSGYSRDGVRRLYMGGGGGGPTQTTSTSYQTNIPEYARPYVDTMLGATQKQLFEGTPTEGGGFDITGFKPYQQYSTNPSDYVAGFSPMQQQSQQTIAGMQVPGQYQAAADITGAGIMGAADVGAQARAFNPMAQQAAGAGRQYQQMATDPNAISAYMSPYMQNVVDTQQREAVRQSDIQRAANMGQATQQGAFGGGRQAIIEAERQRNLGTQLGSIQAQGSQNAFQQAQQAQQYGADLGLKGLTAGAGIYGQGLTAQQQAIQQALGGAGQLAGLGTQALEAQKGIAGLQGQVGAQQQSLEQQKINQSIQDYANAQQYPLMQLGTMSNMLRGLPMQSQTTNQYVAAPNALTQGIGMAGAGASLYNAFNPAAGRAPGMARGGIASVPQYDVGGEVESDLESMSNDALAREAKESPSPIIRQKAQRILRERQMEQAPQAPQGIQYQAPQVPQAPQGMAGGGIIAFKEGNIVGASSEGDEGEDKAVGLDAAGRTMAERLAMPPVGAPPAGGIMGAGAAPAAPAAYVSQAGPAMQRAPDIPEFMKAQHADLVNEANKSLAERMAEKKALYAAEGVADVSEGQRMQRAEMMAEKANLGEERERQKNLRLAEFFAEWGSTPGPTLVAGMNALKKAVPNFVADEKEQKKLRREIDKSIADLDNSMRLEKRGEIDKADLERQKAADKLKDAYGKYLEYDSQRKRDESAAKTSAASDKSRSESSKYDADKRLEAAELTRRGQAGATSQRAEEARLYNIERSLEIARKRLSETEKDIDATRNKPPKGSPLAKAMESVSRYNSMLANSKGDASKISEFVKKEAEQAATIIDRFEADAKRRLDTARAEVKTYEDTYLNQGRPSKSGKTTPPPTMGDNPLGLEIPPPTNPAAKAAAPAPASAPVSRTGDANSANPYVDTKGKARPDAPKGGPSLGSKLIDEATPAVKEAAKKVTDTLSGSELRYLKDKIARNETLSPTDRVRAQRAGLL